MEVGNQFSTDYFHPVNKEEYKMCSYFKIINSLCKGICITRIYCFRSADNLNSNRCTNLKNYHNSCSWDHKVYRYNSSYRTSALLRNLCIYQLWDSINHKVPSILTYKDSDLNSSLTFHHMLYNFEEKPGIQYMVLNKDDIHHFEYNNLVYMFNIDCCQNIFSNLMDKVHRHFHSTKIPLYNLSTLTQNLNHMLSIIRHIRL